MSAPVVFDRDFTLQELLSARDADEMCAAASRILGAPVAMLDAAGKAFGSAAAPAQAARAPLVLELDPLGYIAATCPQDALDAAARLLRVALLARARLRMVSDLHLESVRADYAKLQQQNEALVASERRYRELATTLDATVKAQVKVIDERQRQLYQADRLASIGQLAAGVAHEINNPLGFVKSNLSSAERYLGSLLELRPVIPPAAWQARDLDALFQDFVELIRESRDGVERIARIVRDLKGFSSVDQPEAQFVDLNAQLGSLVAVVRGQQQPGVRVVTDFESLPQLRCVPGQLNQAFLNIVQNAILAVGPGGTVTARTRATGKDVVVQFVDDGPGIPKEVLPRIFDPFFTTRAVGAGTGLGLTVTRDIVHAHDGRIAIDCPPEGGTVVTLTFPAERA